MTIDDALATFLIYFYGLSLPNEFEKILELSLIFWIFSNSCGFDLTGSNNINLEDCLDSFDFEGLNFSQIQLNVIKIKKIFPDLCENYFFFFCERLEGIEINDLLNFISEFNKFMMYENLLNYLLEPFYEY